MELSVERAFSRFDRWAATTWGEGLNPFARLGALAVTSIFIAVVSGVLLLLFYDVSVHGAYPSVHQMLHEQWWFAGPIHSIHRYSADAAMLFTMFHLMRIIGIRAFSGPRAMSWATGVLVTGLLWLVGWTGFWLVWDQAGLLVAQMSARMLDVIPIFGAPLSRGLLLDEPVNNQIFFVVFFIHMLIPLAMVALLWLHVSRVNRPKFIADRKNFILLVGFLLVFSLLIPAPIEEHANPLYLTRKLTGDVLFIGPLWVFQKMSSAGIWLFSLSAYGLFIFFPWIVRLKAPAPSFVTQSACTGCTTCYTDCPYQAIEMIPRTDNKPHNSVAFVHIDRCMSCGICNGSCDTFGNNLPWIPTSDVQGRIQTWAGEIPKGGPKLLLFGCQGALGGGFAPDAATGKWNGLDKYRAVAVPCSGHINPSTLRKAFDLGFEGIYIASSMPGTCLYREGDTWTRERIAMKRKPFGKLTDAHRAKIRIEGYGKNDFTRLASDTSQFAKGVSP